MTHSTPAGADSDQRYNRDDELKPAKEGEPPRPATEPRGGGKASENPHTNTDPVTGRPQP
jgi:hypothetical protein